MAGSSSIAIIAHNADMSNSLTIFEWILILNAVHLCKIQMLKPYPQASPDKDSFGCAGKKDYRIERIYKY
jgi:hypothetical protein